jgi:outer membrane protein OmpA-like peptidoglycan-associated protein
VDSLSGAYLGLHTISKSETSITITLQSEDLAFSSQRMEVIPDAPLEPKSVAIKAQKLEDGKAFPISDLQYGTNASNLEPLSYPILESFADYLRQHATLKLEIRGHTDNKGDPSANLALSTDRAFTVYAFLLNKGVQKNRLSFRGYGDSKPVDSNLTDAGRARNRRTEFYVMKP